MRPPDAEEAPPTGASPKNTRKTVDHGGPKRSVVRNWRRAIRHANADVVGDKAKLTPTERLVALCLSEYMDWYTGGSAYPGAARLARDTGLHAQTVKKALASLKRKGWI